MNEIAGHSAVVPRKVRRVPPMRPARELLDSVGPDLRELRLAQRNEAGLMLRLEDVYRERHGPSPGWLSRVESGQSACGERGLYHLAAALNLPIDEVRRAYSVTRARARKAT